MQLEKRIEQFANDNGFIVGICDAERLDYLDGGEKTADIPFSKYTQEQRITPKLLMPTARSIIVIGVGYGKKKKFEDDGLPRGVFSASAVNIDYHVKIKQILNNLRDFMLEYEKFDSKIEVDTGALSERELAKKAGLAWQGKNGNVYSDALGSFFNIGYMLTTLDLKANYAYATDFSYCGDCDICIKACPSKAISDDGKKLNYNVCVSFLTQKKGELTETEQKLIGNCLYGCDVCQRVCRYNLDKYVGEITKIDSIMPLLSDFTTMTSAEFKDRYGETAIFWRGLKTIKRNAMYAMNNFHEKGDT